MDELSKHDGDLTVSTPITPITPSTPVSPFNPVVPTSPITPIVPTSPINPTILTTAITRSTIPVKKRQARKNSSAYLKIQAPIHGRGRKHRGHFVTDIFFERICQKGRLLSASFDFLTFFSKYAGSLDTIV